MLDVRHLSASYGRHRALDDVSLKVDTGEIVVILGANGAGKSSLLRAIGGICEGSVSGQVDLDGQPILGLPSSNVVEAGVALVPEGRGVFGDLSVRDNLLLGAYPQRARQDERANLARVLSLFPRLSERQSQITRTMSGGEQQMVAIGRAMMSQPQILMLDEPSLGLSPLLCKELFGSLAEVRRAGVGILLVEQNARQSLAIADRGYLLENARIVHEAAAATLTNDPAVQKAYLGAGGGATRNASRRSVTTVDEPTANQGVTNGASAATVDAAESALQSALPPPMLASMRPPPRRSAEQLLGRGIDELVATAAARSAEQSVASDEHRLPPATARPPRDTHDVRLRAMLRDIESAAAGARTPAPGNPPASASATHLSPTRDTHATPTTRGKPAVVEVYRAPRVEVYRRRGNSNDFDRD